MTCSDLTIRSDLKGLRALLIGAACLAVGLAGTGCEGDPPAAPAGLEAASEEGRVALQWDGAGGDITGYNVYRSTDSFEKTGGATKVTSSPTKSPSYTDEGAENGTLYHYRVTALAETGGFLGLGGETKESDPSGEVEKAPFSEPPDRP